MAMVMSSVVIQTKYNVFVYDTAVAVQNTVE